MVVEGMNAWKSPLISPVSSGCIISPTRSDSPPLTEKCFPLIGEEGRKAEVHNARRAFIWVEGRHKHHSESSWLSSDTARNRPRWPRESWCLGNSCWYMIHRILTVFLWHTQHVIFLVIPSPPCQISLVSRCSPPMRQAACSQSISCRILFHAHCMLRNQNPFFYRRNHESIHRVPDWIDCVYLFITVHSRTTLKKPKLLSQYSGLPGGSLCLCTINSRLALAHCSFMHLTNSS